MALVKYNNNSISNVTALASLPSGAMTHIKTITASSDSTISFVNGSSDVVLDSTYPIYLFKCINVHPSSSDEFAFNGSDDTSSHSYNITKTTTHYYAIHAENGTQGHLYYNSSEDLAQSTGFQNLTSASQIGTDNDCVTNGELYLFNPSSTTFVKHFMARFPYMDSRSPQYVYDCFTSGYFNTTSAITAIRFQMGSGNIDAGTFKLYGIKDS
jgi:hypothetical protein|tara:strand:+ start:419 stop:1054 length:636 start_codon:yes stop_codon:yes gene_type:complete